MPEMQSANVHLFVFVAAAHAHISLSPVRGRQAAFRAVFSRVQMPFNHGTDAAGEASHLTGVLPSLAVTRSSRERKRDPWQSGGEKSGARERKGSPDHARTSAAADLRWKKNPRCVRRRIEHKMPLAGDLRLEL